MGDIADLLGSYHARTCVLEERTRRLREEVLPSLDSEQEGEWSAVGIIIEGVNALSRCVILGEMVEFRWCVIGAFISPLN